MNITIQGTTLDLLSLVIGALVILLLVVIFRILKKIFKPRIKLANVKGEIEQAHKHLKEVNENLSNLYRTFNVIEKNQEEIINGPS
jgi:hypothetical protein